MQNESTIQAKVRLDASKLGWRLWRNNVGVLMDSRGVPVRFGLANDSAGVNKIIKSADLIGIRPVIITQDRVGKVIGQFVSIECKSEDYKFNKNNPHDQAQIQWMELITEYGGYAKFSRGDL